MCFPPICIKNIENSALTLSISSNGVYLSWSISGNFANVRAVGGEVVNYGTRRGSVETKVRPVRHHTTCFDVRFTKILSHGFSNWFDISMTEERRILTLSYVIIDNHARWTCPWCDTMVGQRLMIWIANTVSNSSIFIDRLWLGLSRHGSIYYFFGSLFDHMSWPSLLGNLILQLPYKERWLWHLASSQSMRVKVNDIETWT